jgi:putative endonuclease
VATDRHWAEVAAESLLVEAGWLLLARNYRLRGGELDLVFDDGEGTVVFIEVRQRSSAEYGGAGESIDHRKLSRLRRTAAHFLAYGLAKSPKHASHARRELRVRFDAVLVTGVERRYSMQHVKDIA